MTRTIRESLLQAVEELCDPDLQERLWLHGERHSEEEHGFPGAVLVVIDELETEDPRELLGYALRDETELANFSRLAEVLERLMVVIGPQGTFQDALDSGRAWADCVEAAQSLRAALSA